MPARLKIKILGCKNLPVMDKSSETSDAFVEVKIGKTEAKTEVCRHSLNPVFNSEWFKFEIPDEELQDECLQIRIMDYDRYSADDQIGKIYVNLIPLLLKECGHQMYGFFPIYDTMNGVRGELYCAIKMEPFSDSNKFRQSSCGVRFFHSSIVPHGYYATSVLGFVEELVVNDDPEYQWIDKIRTPRASNEARQLLFHKLSAEVQRKLGSKALELGGNAVLGYQLSYDLMAENSSICVRAIGTTVILKKIVKRIDVTSNQVMTRQHTTSLSNPLNEPNSAQSTNVQRSISNSESIEETTQLLAHPVDGQSNNLTINTGSVKKTSPINTTSSASSCRQSSSDLDLINATSPTPKQSTNHLNSIGSNILGNLNLDDLNTMNALEYKFVSGLPDDTMVEYPFITISQFPIGFIKSIGGVVSSRSVKHLSMLNSQEDLINTESREAWLMELRKEIRNHCRMLNCTAVLGYSENITIHDDVCVLSGSGTAVTLNTKSSLKSGSVDNLNDFNSPNNLSKTFDLDDKHENLSPIPLSLTNKPNCSLCHIPYSEKPALFGSTLANCRFCGKSKVPDVIFATIQPPLNLPTVGKGALIQARVFRNKKDTRAKELSDSLPFLEYEMHKQLLSKLKLKNMNSIFNLNVQISVGDNTLVALATGTALFITPLQEPNPIKVKGSSKSVRTTRLNDIQKMISDLVERNKQRYDLVNLSSQLNPIVNNLSAGNELNNQLNPIVDGKTELVSPHALIQQTNIAASNQSSFDNCVVLEVDDGDETDISLLLDAEVPASVEICNTDYLPGNEPFLSIYNTFNKVFRAKITSPKLFSNQFDYIIQSLFVKLRRLTPCCIAGLRFKVDAGAEDNIVQISVLGTVVGIRNLNQSLMSKNGLSLYLPTHCYQDKKTKYSNDNEFVFESEEDNCEKLDLPSTITSVFNLQNRGSPASVELTTLSYLPRCKIVKYIGTLTFPFIREVTSIRECGGLNGFLTSFLNELLLIVRAHIVGLDGNALISMNITQLVLLHNPHKNQAQCLIVITGDVVKVNYCKSFSIEDKISAVNQQPQQQPQQPQQQPQQQQQQPQPQHQQPNQA